MKQLLCDNPGQAAKNRERVKLGLDLDLDYWRVARDKLTNSFDCACPNLGQDFANRGKVKRDYMRNLIP